MSDYVYSESTSVERGIKKMISLERYNFCGNCHAPLIKTTARGYQNGHQTIFIGYWCRKCNTLYVNDKNVKVVNYTKTLANVPQKESTK